MECILSDDVTAPLYVEFDCEQEDNREKKQHRIDLVKMTWHERKSTLAKRAPSASHFLTRTWRIASGSLHSIEHLVRPLFSCQ